MDQLSDEIILLIFCLLDNPAPLTVASKRFYDFSQDPYVRSSYFIARYGRQYAFYRALGKGKLLNERVIDILLSSGAYFSRYLVQCVIQHTCRKPPAFIKGRWARSLGFPVFAHLLKVAAERFDEVELTKGEDDGSLFQRWLSQKKLPVAPHLHSRLLEWEKIVEIFQTYKFYPFSPKDPILLQIPLALALEPRLLPLVTANGFRMDIKYRNFIFRKMFEKPFTERDGRAAEIVANVLDMCGLDESMFISRTVAAEVCMEACTNEPAYEALKKLDRSGCLLFNLEDLIADLLKLFLKTRSVANTNTIQTIHKLYKDFSAPNNPSVRLVILLTIFCSRPTESTPEQTKAELVAFGLFPLSTADIVDLLNSPFFDNVSPLLAFAKAHVEDFGNTDMEHDAVAQVMHLCLANSCKGKLVRKLSTLYPFLEEKTPAWVRACRITLDDIPCWYADEGKASNFHAEFNIGFGSMLGGGTDMYELFGATHGGEEAILTGDEEEDDGEGSVDDVKMDGQGYGYESSVDGECTLSRDLGLISQDTLSARIQAEEGSSRNGRRRWWSYRNLSYGDASLRLPFPADAQPVGKWVRDKFGARHEVTAVFFTHALINGNAAMLSYYLEPMIHSLAERVPLTLEHFKILAKLGRAPAYPVWKTVEANAPFYFSADDYLNAEVKVEEKMDIVPAAQTTTSSRGGSPRKRPRRSTASSAPQYTVPDSDDEMIADDVHKEEKPVVPSRKSKEKAQIAPDLELWIKHLSLLLKDEEKKLKEKKRFAERDEDGKLKRRVVSSEFYRALHSRIAGLREELAVRCGDTQETYSDDDEDEGDGEFVLGASRRKRARRSTRIKRDDE